MNKDREKKPKKLIS